MNSQASNTKQKRTIRYLWAAVATVAVGAGLMSCQGWGTSSTEPTTKPSVVSEKVVPQFVSALGRIEPESRVLKLTGGWGMEGARIEKLLVEEGDVVTAGQIVAVLDLSIRRQATLDEARARVEVAKSRLAQVEAGAKSGDVLAQEAMVARAEATLENARLELKRAESLLASQILTQSEWDKRRLEFKTAQETRDHELAALESLKEIRQVDRQLRQAEVVEMEAAAGRAQAEFEATRIRAPVGGNVLRIRKRTGESLGTEGLLELGNVSAMFVVAEVYESDISRVQQGMSASAVLRSSGLSLQGRVESTGWLIGRKVVLDNDPVTDTDARVVEVRIRLNEESSQAVKQLSNARVEVRIDPQSKPAVDAPRSTTEAVPFAGTET